MAAKSSSKTDTSVDTKASNPSGASDEQIKKGELAGKVRGPNVDSSYHVYDFTDPETGEPVEWTPVVHDVMTKSDGTTEKGDATFAQPSGEGEGGASGGEAGETKTGGTSS